jgi:hypothetical protein
VALLPGPCLVLVRYLSVRLFGVESFVHVLHVATVDLARAVPTAVVLYRY